MEKHEVQNRVEVIIQKYQVVLLHQDSNAGNKIKVFYSNIPRELDYFRTALKGEINFVVLEKEEYVKRYMFIIRTFLGILDCKDYNARTEI